MNEILVITFCCIEHSSRFSTTSLPVDAVGQRSDEILLRALHDHRTHFMKLFGVVDSTVKLGVGIREFCKLDNKRAFNTSITTVSICIVWRPAQGYINAIGRNTHVAQYVDWGSVSSVYPSSLHPLHQTVQKSHTFHLKYIIQMFSIFCELNCYLTWRLTEGISVHTAAALLGRGWLTGPGRAALRPTLPTTEGEKARFVSFSCILPVKSSYNSWTQSSQWSPDIWITKLKCPKTCLSYLYF